jgi:hypothetical protein
LLLTLKPHFIFIFWVVVGIDEVEAAKEGLRIVLDIIGHDELDQLWPYLEVIVLVSIAALIGGVELVGKGNHFVERAHEVRGIVSVRPEVKGEIIFEQEVIFGVIAVVNFTYQRSNAFAGSAETALRVFEHQFGQNFCLYRVDPYHQFFPNSSLIPAKALISSFTLSSMFLLV